MFFDTYLVAANKAALNALCQNFSATLGPTQGRAAMDSTVTPEGEIIAARDKAGDPSLFYACLRTPTPLPDTLALPEGITICPEPEGVAVLGLWA